MRHTALLALPDKLEAFGLNVLVADDWELGQGSYLWTDPHTGTRSYNGPPSGYMVHHTATTRATPPPHDTSKANAWIGLLRDGKLYQAGGGVPTIYLASAGPARISSGYGYHPAAWAHTFLDRRAPVKAEGPDGIRALNRYVVNAEVVHAGDGTPLDAGVWRHVVGLGIELHRMFGWTERTLGHRSWTRRKTDPYWNDDRLCITEIQNAIAKQLTTKEAEMWPKLGDRDNPTARQFAIETWQLKLAALDGHPYTGGRTRTSIEAAGMTIGAYDDAMDSLVKRFTDSSGGGIGPREAAQIDSAISGSGSEPATLKIETTMVPVVKTVRLS